MATARPRWPASKVVGPLGGRDAPPQGSRPSPKPARRAWSARLRRRPGRVPPRSQPARATPRSARLPTTSTRPFCCFSAPCAPSFDPCGENRPSCQPARCAEPPRSVGCPSTWARTISCWRPSSLLVPSLLWRLLPRRKGRSPPRASLARGGLRQIDLSDPFARTSREGVAPACSRIVHLLAK